MVFRRRMSPLDEMKSLQMLSKRDPESAANLVANGKFLVNIVRDGNLRALMCAVEQLQEGQVLTFYAVRMFREACAIKRLDILHYMLQNGFDLQQSYMWDTLHSIIETVDSNHSAELVQPLIRFLLNAGIDVNWQRKSDLFTALHVACCKNLYSISYLLVIYGADVNAVAADDAMPLSCVKNIEKVTEAERTQMELLKHFLLKRQARTSWRKQNCPTTAINVSSLNEAVGLFSPKSRHTPATMINRPILSFSSSFGIQSSVEESIDDQNQPGLVFDTTDSY
ncbi:Ankyrin repeat-containing domain [Plasmopara halstedii]|uniref:Ankyrin repeat-containing domain n=1 Tax=Plasmopara halstedii TaxID=4781 RepID=A0A0P1A917_PLAHL|nr:Ankyrin repeat-containing domain [Plasmopara halstedii]CEG36568.1 Ankyrin repeat-containing domain [Plasmopara halstedii]|eukprot:XP_024572937.1 Ankyrin repeat-containing domain [Plasmopara halstedii]